MNESSKLCFRDQICPLTCLLLFAGLSVLITMMAPEWYSFIWRQDDKHGTSLKVPWLFVRLLLAINIPTAVNYCVVCKLHSDLIQADKWPISSHPSASQHALPSLIYCLVSKCPICSCLFPKRLLLFHFSFHQGYWLNRIADMDFITFHCQKTNINVGLSIK